MAANDLEICGLKAEPGSRASGRVAAAAMADGSTISIPLILLNGIKSGPKLYIQAAVHGDEITGTEIAREVALGVDPLDLEGSLIVVPIANVPAYLTRSRSFALEERAPINMHGSFPGDPNGLLTERIAYKIFNDIVLQCDYAIDMHTGLTGSCVYPFSYVCPTDNLWGTLEKREAMALACATGLVYYLSREDCKKFKSIENYDHTFFEQAHMRGIPTILLEMGEGGRVTHEFVPIGVEGIKNVMRQLGMLKGEVKRPERQVKFTKIHVARPNTGGLARIKARLGSQIRAGDLAAEVVGPFGDIEEVRSPESGTVLRVLTMEVVYPGAELIWVAR